MFKIMQTKKCKKIVAIIFMLITLILNVLLERMG